jgi:hypothetical protein
MEKKSFQSSITANISANEAMKRISNVPEWWGITFSGNSQKQNDKFIVKMGGDSFFNFTVAELIPDKRIVWSVTDCHMPWYSDKKEWANTKLIFDLVEKNGVTRLNFTHEGLTPDVECYKDCNPGWTHWIKTSLFSYFTTGNGDFNKNFHRTITVNASAAEAMKKISQVNGWWAKNFSGKAEKLDDKFTVRFGETFVDFLISEFVPDKKVVWKVTDCNLHWIKTKKEWNDTEVVFEIASEDNKTEVNFTHVGLVRGVECYDDCEVGWNGHVTMSLLKFINEGIGTPE